MKSQKGSRIKAVFNQVFNVKNWLDYERLKGFTLYLFNGVKGVFVPKPQVVEDKSKSFSEVVATLELTEEELTARKKGLYRLSMVMFIVGLSILCYGIYNLIMGFFLATMVSVVVASIGFVLAFRYHFWYYQIQQRKLGCTFKEWYRQFFR